MIGIHAGIAAFSNAPHWALDPQEASSLSGAIERLAAHYPKIASSQKMVDWIFALNALAMVYGPRIYLSAAPVKKPQAPPVGSNVTPFQGGM